MRKTILAATAILLVATPILAADDIMANFYGNTVVVTGGLVDSYTHFRPDHTFDSSAIVMGMKMTRKGTWSIDDKGQLCRLFDNPPPGTPNPFCTPAESHKLGDSWIMTVNGKTRTVFLKPGIQ